MSGELQNSGRAGPEAHVLSIKAGAGSYELVIGDGLLRTAGERLTRVLVPDAPVLLVYDESLDRFGYPQRVAESMRAARFTVHLAPIPSGEDSKSIEQAVRLYGRCIAEGLDRSSAIAALGGGVVGDLAGFVAATYMRGVRFVQIPTTLLAHDASIGGKVGINLPEGKNLVGAFHAPKMVLYDVSCLRTLPREEMSSGLAEAVKHGVIRSPELFRFVEERAAELLRGDADALEKLLLQSCAIKADVVQQDERESGLRAILNFGHTVGHAIEALSYGRFSHGAAVSIGMVAETRLAIRMGICAPDVADRLRTVLGRAGLPSELPPDLRSPARSAELVEFMRRDKKAAGRSLSFVLPERIGAVRIVKSAPESDVLGALQERP